MAPVKVLKKNDDRVRAWLFPAVQLLIKFVLRCHLLGMRQTRTGRAKQNRNLRSQISNRRFQIANPRFQIRNLRLSSISKFNLGADSITVAAGQTRQSARGWCVGLMFEKILVCPQTCCRALWSGKSPFVRHSHHAAHWILAGPRHPFAVRRYCAGILTERPRTLASFEHRSLFHL